jgi:hypothetical protein
MNRMLRFSFLFAVYTNDYPLHEAYSHGNGCIGIRRQERWVPKCLGLRPGSGMAFLGYLSVYHLILLHMCMR